MKGRRTPGRHEVIARRAARDILEAYPRVLGIFLDGSVGRGEPGPYSDIDLLVVVRGRPPRWFSRLDSGILVTVGFLTTAKYRGALRNPQEFLWARGGASSARILHDTRGLLRKLRGERLRAGFPPRLQERLLANLYEEVIEYAGKLRNGHTRRDAYLVQYAARAIAGFAETAVLGLNDLSPRTENVLWHVVSAAQRKPRHFVVDYPVAAGLRGTPRTDHVYRAALRLASETLHLVRDTYSGKARIAWFKEILAHPPESVGL